MKWIIDRIEGDYALCEIEDMGVINIPVAALPKGAGEGNVISISIDNDETQERKDKISSMMNDLFVD